MLRALQRGSDDIGAAHHSQLNLANKLTSTLGSLDPAQSGLALKDIFYRHFAWLTALRFFLREQSERVNEGVDGANRIFSRSSHRDTIGSLDKPLHDTPAESSGES
jgi:putative membrane protein